MGACPGWPTSTSSPSSTGRRSDYQLALSSGMPEEGMPRAMASVSVITAMAGNLFRVYWWSTLATQ